MITGTHAIIYANDADRARAFFRDVLGLPNVDAHGGWLIFKLPPAELGIHPAGAPGDPAASAPSGHHELYLMCDNVEATVADLTAKGVEFTAPIEEQGFGFGRRLRAAGLLGSMGSTSDGYDHGVGGRGPAVKVASTPLHVLQQVVPEGASDGV